MLTRLETGAPRHSSTSVADALSALVAASSVSAFSSATWPHHEALVRIAAHAKGPGLKDITRAWTFAATSYGKALVGLPEILWSLAAEGWLAEDSSVGRYLVTPEFAAHGRKRLASLCADDRRLFQRVARNWRAWVSTRSKNFQ